MRVFISLLVLIITAMPVQSGAQEIGIKGKVLIQQFEGLRLCRYNDVAGKATIGHGHLITASDTLPTCITPMQAYELLMLDLVIVNKCLNRYVGNKAAQNQYDALGSFTFNLGCGSLRQSTLLKLHKKEFHDQAAEQFLRWVYAGGKYYRGLHLRRIAEKTLYRAGA